MLWPGHVLACAGTWAHNPGDRQSIPKMEMKANSQQRGNIIRLQTRSQLGFFIQFLTVFLTQKGHAMVSMSKLVIITVCPAWAGRRWLYYLTQKERPFHLAPSPVGGREAGREGGILTPQQGALPKINRQQTTLAQALANHIMSPVDKNSLSSTPFHPAWIHITWLCAGILPGSQV